MAQAKTKRGEERLYFTLGGSRKIYLGTPKHPKRQNLRQALAYLNGKIGEYEKKYDALEQMLVPDEETETFRSKFKLIVFDLDGVLYDKPWCDVSSERSAVSSWDLLFKELEIYPMHEKLKQRFEEGGFKSYMEWTEAACHALQMAGLDRNTFQRVIEQRPLMPGAEHVLRVLQKSDAKIAVVTGSFEELAIRLRKSVVPLEYGAHCAFVFDDKGALKSWKLQKTDYDDKGRFVASLGRKLGIAKEYRAYVGDDVNDIPAFQEVGLSIAFNADKPKVRLAADVVIESRNLKSILPHLQDYADAAELDELQSKLVGRRTQTADALAHTR
jgi:phosphoserine phosphatase